MTQLMLLTDCQHPRELFIDDAWVAEEKLDGDRCYVVKAGQHVMAFSRNHRQMTLSDESMALAMLSDDFIIDGEMMPGGKFIAFDILSYKGKPVIDRSNSERAELLRAITSFPTVRRSHDKLDLFNQIRAEGGEGIVFKCMNDGYIGGRSDGCQRYKLYETEIFTVTEVHIETMSVTISKDGKEWGRVRSSMGKLPKVGQELKVRFECYTDNGKLLRARIVENLTK